MGLACICLIIITVYSVVAIPTPKTELKLPDKAVILPGLIAALVYATYGIVVDWSAHWLSTESRYPPL